MIRSRGLLRSRFGPLCVASLCALAAASGTSAGRSRPDVSPRATGASNELTPVIQSVLSPPRWFAGDAGRVHLEYELLLTNAVPVPATVVSLEVLSGRGVRLVRLSGRRLHAAMGWEGVAGSTTRLRPYAVGIAWIDLRFRDASALPRRIKQRLTIELPPGLPVPSRITETSASIAIADHPPTTIAPPLRGGRWVAVVGAHRRALQPINGRLRNGQRFAIDFAGLLDSKRRTRVGNPDRASSYFCYGQPVLAVGNATVVEAVDRYRDQIPNHPVPVGTQAGDGNHVIIKLAPGIFAAYAHLKLGSVRVHAGERVRTGQILGQLGNSGNTTGPHLHFQLMTRPAVLDSDGLPFVLTRFRLVGRAPSLKAFLDADLAGTPVPINRSVAGEHRQQGFTDLDIVTFPRG
jgi:hypothetical protein